MPRIQRYKLTCPQLADYFRQAFRPRDEWMVGIEVETMGRDASTSHPLAYEAEGASVRRVIEAYAAERGGALVFEGDRPVGIDAAWGGITLEPGGQVEWSSRPARDLSELGGEIDGLVLQFAFDLATLLVVALEHLRGGLRLDDAGRAQQRRRVERVADAACGVDQRRDAERDVLDVG